MAVEIKLKGPVILDDSAWLYKYLNSPAIYPERIKSELESANGEDVTLLINSGGGTIASAFEIVDLIRKYEGHVTARILCAMSAATLIACAADEVVMPDAGIYMIHNAFIQFNGKGDYRDFERKADSLRQYNESIINVYTKHTGLSKERIQELMDEDTYMSVDRAIELGFVDKKEDEEEAENVADILVTNSVYSVFTEEKIADLKKMFEKAKASDSDTGEMPDGDNSSPNNQGRNPEMSADDAGNAEKGQKPEEVSDSDTNNGSDINIKGKAGNKMTLEEFLKENPSEQAAVDAMVSAANEEGAKAERQRLQELDQIAKSVTAKALDDAKYGDKPMDAKELSFQALKDDTIRAASYMKDVQGDAGESGAEEVGGAPDDPENNGDNEADSVANYINKRRGKVE